MRTLVLTALIVLAGCSSAPPASDTAIASTAGATAAPAGAAEPAKAADAERQFKPPPGFKAKILDWNVVYCRKTAVLGSRFPKEICMTEAELKEHMASTDEMKRDKDQVSRVCSMAAGCANP
jgi:hypothetical protein